MIIKFVMMRSWLDEFCKSIWSACWTSRELAKNPIIVKEVANDGL